MCDDHKLVIVEEYFIVTHQFSEIVNSFSKQCS